MGLLVNVYTWAIVESSTKQYTTSRVVNPEMQHLKADPYPDFIIQLSSRVLTMAHMAGCALFPCLGPWLGGFSINFQVYPP